jgi:signal transduction histidine kinase/ActR/RegA family two-component response regulator
METASTWEYCVAMLASTEADAEIARRVLQDAQIGFVACASADQLCKMIERGVGAVMVPEEVLTSSNAECLSKALDQQPPWSNLPFIVLRRPPGSSPEAAVPWSRIPGALLIERPVRIENLLSAIRSSLDARRRQYAMRDLLVQMQQVAEERAALQQAAEKSRAAAEAANRMKDEFLAVLSHELRTPLNAILGWAALLRRNSLTGEQVQRAVESIERNSRLQAQLIDDLLDVSRVISGSLRLDMQQLELSDVVEEAIATVTPASDSKGVVLERGVADSSLLRGDSARLQQIVWNLLSNAIKFTPAGGRVRVELRQQGGCAELQVIDTGEGIEPELLPRVFERFWQADSSSTRTRGGLGLGLAIVKHLVQLHGGSVHAASPGRGRGATFTVRLPLAATEADEVAANGTPLATQSKSDALTDRLTGTRILLVDDDPESLQVLSVALTGIGATVVTASSAERAWEIACQATPDVIVSDISMPQEDGYSLIRRLRAHAGALGRNLPVIALTAHARPEDRKATFEAGFNAHLAKPVDPMALIQCVLTCRTPQS